MFLLAFQTNILWPLNLSLSKRRTLKLRDGFGTFVSEWGKRNELKTIGKSWRCRYERVAGKEALLLSPFLINAAVKSLSINYKIPHKARLLMHRRRCLYRFYTLGISGVVTLELASYQYPPSFDPANPVPWTGDGRWPSEWDWPWPWKLDPWDQGHDGEDDSAYQSRTTFQLPLLREVGPGNVGHWTLTKRRPDETKS